MSKLNGKLLDTDPKITADALRRAGLLPESDYDTVYRDGFDFAEQAQLKFDAGAQEHGGSIFDRDLGKEIFGEVMDIFWYTKAQKYYINALKAALHDRENRRPDCELVREFRDKFQLPYPKHPQDADGRVIGQALDRVKEEFGELMTAAKADDTRGILDALVDLKYTIAGVALAMGYDLDVLMQQVHENNMIKMWTKQEIEQNIKMFADGSHIKIDTNPSILPTHRTYIVKRVSDMKVIKPPSHSGLVFDICEHAIGIIDDRREAEAVALLQSLKHSDERTPE